MAANSEGLLAEWRVEDIVGKNDGDAVTSWVDRVSGKTLSAAGTGAVYRVNKFNGQAGIEFAGSAANYLSMAYDAALTLSGGGTVLVTFRKESGGATASQKIVLFETSASGYTVRLITSSSNALRFEVWRNSGGSTQGIIDGAATNGSVTIFAGMVDGSANGAARQATSSADVAATISGSYTPTAAGATFDVGKDFFGTIASIQIWDRKLSNVGLQNEFYDLYTTYKAAAGSGSALPFSNCVVQPMGTMAKLTFTGSVSFPVNFDNTKIATYAATTATPDGGTTARTPLMTSVQDIAIVTGNTVVTVGLDYPIWQNDTGVTVNQPAGLISDVAGNTTGGSGGAVSSTNSSTCPYPLVNARFGGYTYPRRAFTGSVIVYVDAEDFSGYGIAKVAFSATGGTSSHTEALDVTSKSVLAVNAAIRSEFGSRLPPKAEFYTWNLDLSSFTAGETITITAVVWPVVGQASEKRTLTLTIFKDDGSSFNGTRYVSNSGNDTTGDGSQGNPYRSIMKAAVWFRANGKKGGTIYVPQGQAFSESPGGTYTDNSSLVGEILVRPTGNGTKADTSVQFNATELQNGTGDYYICFQDLTLYVQGNNALKGVDNVSYERCLVDSLASPEYNRALQFVSLDNAAWTAATKTLTQSGKMTAYNGQWQSGDKIWLWNAGTAGQYTVASVASNDAITLVESLNATDLASGVKTPPFDLRWCATTTNQYGMWDCEVKGLMYSQASTISISNMFGVKITPNCDAIRNGGSVACVLTFEGTRYASSTHVDHWQGDHNETDFNTLLQCCVLSGTAAQCLFADANDEAGGFISNISVKNCLMVQQTGSQYLAQFDTGNNQILRNIKISHCTFANAGIYLRPGATAKYYNVLFEGVDATGIGAKHPSDAVDGRTYGARFVHCHSRGGVSQMGPGQRQDVTSGSEGFSGSITDYDTDRFDYRPTMNLIGRMGRQAVIDVWGNRRASTTAIGAAAASAEYAVASRIGGRHLRHGRRQVCGLDLSVN